MSDIIGFLFGWLCGFCLAIIFFADYVRLHSDKHNTQKPHTAAQCKNVVFSGYRPTGILNTNNPPRGGTGVPEKYPILSETEKSEYGSLR